MNWPPDDHVVDFRVTLERVYRDYLLRGLTSTYVDVVGQVVHTQAYTRKRLDGLSHEAATRAVIRDVWHIDEASRDLPVPDEWATGSASGLLPTRLEARRWQANMWHAVKYLWMLPGFSSDDQDRALDTLAALNVSHVAFSPYGDYNGLYRMDYRHDHDGFARVLDRCLQRRVTPVVFLVTDEASGGNRERKEADITAYLRSFLPFLAQWARERGAGAEDRVLSVCLGWEIQQVQPWLVSGRAQHRLMRVIREYLPPSLALLYWHPAPHRSVPHDETTLAGWPCAWPGEETDDDTGGWRKWLLIAQEAAHLDGVLLNVGSPQAMPEARLREYLMRGDPPTFENYHWWGPHPGCLGRYHSVGLDVVLFEHGYKDRSLWERQAEWARQCPLLSGYA